MTEMDESCTAAAQDDAGDNPGESRLVPAIVALIIGAALALVPVRVVNLGFFPSDDALRHAAKVVSGKPWGDILELRSGLAMDHHPGWHAILGVLWRFFGLDVTQLVIASVMLLFLLFSLTPFFFLERKESWAAALLILATGHMTNIWRLLIGRPYILSMAVLLIILFAGPSLREVKTPRRILVLVTLAIAAAVWIHGSWFLFALPLMAFLAAREWRATVNLGFCTLAGLLLGASLTGKPYAFLKQNFLVAWHAFGGLPIRKMLVVEFQSFDGYPMIVVAVLALIFWRCGRGDWHNKFLDNPAFILAASCYVLGFVSSRFWLDWGVPAFCVWTAREIQDILRNKTAQHAWSRVGVATVLSVSLVLVATNDFGYRYSDSTVDERLSLKNPDQAPWLPGEGGIVYSNSMGVFYRTFFENPHTSWKYILGFEPTMMPEEDLEVYRQHFLTDNSPLAFKPWINKMRAEDRLILNHSSEVAPLIPKLEWFHATRDLWIGRLPRGRQ
jgi:hypothetical protein